MRANTSANRSRNNPPSVRTLVATASVLRLKLARMAASNAASRVSKHRSVSSAICPRAAQRSPALCAHPLCVHPLGRRRKHLRQGSVFMALPGRRDLFLAIGWYAFCDAALRDIFARHAQRRPLKRGREARRRCPQGFLSAKICAGDGPGNGRTLNGCRPSLRSLPPSSRPRGPRTAGWAQSRISGIPASAWAKTASVTAL